MKTIDPIGLRERNLERIAARHGLTFYLDGRFLVSISGWDSTTREATDEEITMWSIISLENPDYLTASPDEKGVLGGSEWTFYDQCEGLSRS
jgi:hypothetical protein